MATFSNADIEAALFEHVDPVMTEQFEQERVLFNLIGEAGEQLNARGTRITSRSKPNPSFTWYSESGAMPTPGKEEYIEQKVFTTRCAQGFEFSGDFLDQIDTEESLIRGLSTIMANYTDAAKKKLNQALYGDGTGELAVLKTNSSSTSGIMSLTVADGSLFGARKLEIGGLYNWYSSAGVARTGGTGAISQVTAKTESTATVTFDATLALPTDAVATDIAVHNGAYNKAAFGLKKHVNNDTGAYQGQSRATYPFLKAGVDDAGLAGITVGRLNKNKYALRYRVAGTEAMNVTLISAPTQFDLFTRLGHNLIRFAGGGGEFRGDFDTAKHGNSEWIQDVDCDEDRIYGLDLSTFKRYQMAPFGILRKDGMDYRMYTSNGTGSDKYTGWVGVKFNLACRKPNANFVIRNLATTDGAIGTASLG